MALKAVEGFDTYNNARADMLSRTGLDFLQWQIYGANNQPTLSFVPGFEGDGKAFQIAGVGGPPGPNSGLPTEWPVAVWGARNQTATIGVRLNNNPSGGTINNLPGCTFYFYDTIANTIQITVLFNPLNYAVEIYRGQFSVFLGASPNNFWDGNQPNYVEIQPFIAPGTGGSVHVRVNYDAISGAGADYNLTSVNTQASVNAWFDATGFSPAVMTGVAGTGGVISLDDLYYCDTTVTAGLYPNNSFLGDIHAYTRFPNGNNAVQWTPLTLTNWQMVDETAMDSDATYNSTITPGNEDTFNLPTLPGVVNNIIAIIIQGAYRKDDAGAHSVKQALVSNGVTYYGPPRSLQNTTYGYLSDIFELDPNTGANWTILHANGMAAGYNLVS